MKNKDEKYQKYFGLIFLLGFTALAAYLNYTNAHNKLGAYLIENNYTIPMVIITYWSAIILLFIPIYWIFSHSVRKWNWSLEEWGFGLHKKALIGIGLTVFSIFFVAFQLNKQKPDIETHSIPIFALIIIGCARVAEELLYRGFALILLRKIFKKSPFGTVWAIIISSALFTLMHTHKPELALKEFIGGSLLIAIITVWTGSISLAVIYHSLAGGGLVGASVAALFFISMVLINIKLKKSANNAIHLTGKPAGDGKL